jgi:hypothetical protein
MQIAPRRPGRAQRCGVCGFAELRTDEVVDRGLVLLAECPRCEHRSTQALAVGPRRAAAKVVREVVPAA